MKRQAFTLVELLVVIAIIGLLSTIAVFATSTARDKAKIVKANADIQQIYKQIELARNNNNAPLTSIVAGGCSDCNCRAKGDLSVLPSNDSCITSMAAFFTGIGMPNMLRDPWGSPYLMDQNELETPGNCVHDVLFSAGPNRIDNGYAGDDIVFSVPFFQCP